MTKGLIKISGFAWSATATVLVVLASIEYNEILWGSGAADASIMLWAAALLGLPAWLSIAALTVKRWGQTSKLIATAMNVPAIIGSVIYGANYLGWMK